MAEQLYKIDGITAKPHNDMAAYLDGYLVGRLVPVPAPHTLAWALGEMLRNPMREYGRVPHERWRWNPSQYRIEWYSCGKWDCLVIINDDDMESTSWSPCEAEESKPTQPQASPTLEQRVERLEKLMEVKR